MEVITFIFESFWHFAGTVVILGLIGQLILKSIAIINIRKIGEAVSDESKDKEEK
jgi:hypothetical protein